MKMYVSSNNNYQVYGGRPTAPANPEENQAGANNGGTAGGKNSFFSLLGGMFKGGSSPTPWSPSGTTDAIPSLIGEPDDGADSSASAGTTGHSAFANANA